MVRLPYDFSQYSILLHHCATEPLLQTNKSLQIENTSAVSLVFTKRGKPEMLRASNKG